MKRNNQPTHIVYDAGCSTWTIEKYNPLIVWHDDNDIIKCYSYNDAVKQADKENLRQYKFDSCISLYDHD